MKLFANTLTWITHPILLTIPGIYLITFYSTGKIETALFWTIVSLIFSAIVCSFVLVGVKMKFFNNIDVSNRKQRVILYPFATAVVITFALLIYILKGPQNLILGTILFIVALIILDIINRKIKASIHVASVSAFITGLTYLFGGWIFLSILLIPLVAWARVIEKKHTPRETVVGACCGIILTILSICVVQFIK